MFLFILAPPLSNFDNAFSIFCFNDTANMDDLPQKALQPFSHCLVFHQVLAFIIRRNCHRHHIAFLVPTDRDENAFNIYHDTTENKFLDC